MNGIATNNEQEINVVEYLIDGDKRAFSWFMIHVKWVNVPK